MGRAVWFLVPLLSFAFVPPLAASDPAGLELFEKKIRPVLVEQCFRCHSAEAEQKKKLRGGLFLDTRFGLLKGGDTGPAIAPGKAKDSLLWQSLQHAGDLKMPPGKKLPESVLADFAAWINRAPDPRTGGPAGKQVGLSIAEGRKFWSYRPLARAALPTVTGPQSNEIDAFILAKLEAKDLTPAPEADRVTLLRRLSFALVGLPPTPEEIDAFTADSRPDAYERLVERLLASPGFGERWGRHWLDVARYADSLTLRGFILREAWRYRDYVIDHFNEDAPFDRFIREQLAGDLLRAATPDERRRALIALAFLALGNTNLEEQDKVLLRMDVVDEQLDAIGRAFLGQTISCARCHDHKFDPIPTRDYYALAGILRNTKTLTHSNVSMWLEARLPAPPDRQAEIEKHEAVVAALQAEVRTLKGRLGKKVAANDPNKPMVRALADLPGIVVDDTQARKVGEWKDSTHSGAYVHKGYVHDGSTKRGEKTITFQPTIPKTGKYEVRLAYSPGTNRATNAQVTVFSADGENVFHLNQKKTPDVDGLFHSLGRFSFESSGQGFVIVSNEGADGHVIADAVQFLPAEPIAEKVAKTPAAKGDKDAETLRRLETRLKALTDSGPTREMTLTVQEEATIENVRIHVRGSPHNLGATAPRGFLEVTLRDPSKLLPAGESGRKELADWVADRDNPLTARVYANRAWHWLFGTGLVRTTDNFGTTGELPSHPELIDHLAARFIEDGWSVKSLVRRIVLSQTFRRAAVADPKAKALDPENRLLAGVNRRRLEAEPIRDAMLAVGGRLALDKGGPTYKRALAADYGYKHTDARRSVYAPVFRNSLPELFAVFDFADPSVPTGRRNVSTAAPQALYLMNHPFVLESSRGAARRLLSENEPEPLTRAYRRALGRAPTREEARLARMFLGSSPSEEEWARLFQVLFASIDFRFVD